MPPKAEVLDRLLLAKSFLDRIRFQPVAIHDRHTVASHIIASHDAAELSIAAICDQLGALPNQRGNVYLMEYFEPLERATGKTAHAKEYFRNLNQTRNALKHSGLFPDSKQWSRVAESCYGHITKWCGDFLGLGLSTLDDSALISNEDVKRLYDEARTQATKGNFKGALENIAVALAYVFHLNPALRGFQAGTPNSDEAIRLAGFGVHGNNFLALQQFLPHVVAWGENKYKPKWKQSEFGHPGNWTEDNVEFCLRTFVDLVVKIQDARWIPGALPRSVLYDQQVEALKDNVEIWRHVAVDKQGNPYTGLAGILAPGVQMKREIIRTLKKGEQLRAFVNVSKESSGNAVQDALGGLQKNPGVLDIHIFGRDIGHSVFGQIAAADVKVTCVPKEEEWTRENYPGLAAFDWVPD